MRTKSIGLTVSATIGVLLGWNIDLSRAQPGPDGGAVLRNPFDEPAPRRTPDTGVPQGPSAQTNNLGSTSFDQILSNLSVDPRYAMNRDIEPFEKLGPCMICVHSYVTKEAPEWARQMTAELRSKYNLPAYVFTYGLEERRKEYERVKVQLDRQRAFMKDQDLQMMYQARGKGKDDATPAILADDVPLAVAMRTLKVQHIPVQCAVLVGGYPNQDAAKRALDHIRDLPAPDPTRVKLDIKFYDKGDPNKQYNAEGVYVNPFKKAFVCGNPSIPQHRPQEAGGFDMDVLRRLNADEPYTLLNCKKPITLAIKQFQTFTTVESKENAPGILEKFGFKTRAGQGVDQPAHDAHNLAEILRKNKLEAYVLHTKFTSVVTVGGYDSLEDPNLRAMQSTLESRLRAPEWAQLMFFPRPAPMKVPH